VHVGIAVVEIDVWRVPDIRCHVDCEQRDRQRIAFFAEYDIHTLIGRADCRHHPTGARTDDQNIRI